MQRLDMMKSRLGRKALLYHGQLAAMGRRCRHDCAEGRQARGVASDGCTNMIASDMLPESLADPAASVLTAGRKLM